MKKVSRFRNPPEDLNVTYPTGRDTPHPQTIPDAVQLHSGLEMPRTTGRIKKPRTVYDPSDYNAPRAAQRAIAGVGFSGVGGSGMPQNVNSQRVETPHLSSRLEDRATSSPREIAEEDCCAICFKGEVKRGVTARLKRLHACIKCQRKIHKVCYHVEFEDMDVVKATLKCKNCRSCDKCDPDGTKMDHLDLVTCSLCAKSYHAKCHKPNVAKDQLSQTQWKCSDCCTPMRPPLTTKSVRTSSQWPNDNTVVPARRASMSHNAAAADPQSSSVRSVMPMRSLTPMPTPSRTSISPSSILHKDRPIPAREIRTIIGDDKLPPTLSFASNSMASPKNSCNKLPTLPKRDPVSKANGAHDITHEKSENLLKRCHNGSSTDLQQKTSNGSEPNTTDRYDPLSRIDIPDVSEWTVNDVFEYFNRFFPREAHLFKEHEIDGTSLKLLKRSDVVKKLPIKLGPSLRIYSLILRIQTRSNDPTLGWK